MMRDEKVLSGRFPIKFYATALVLTALVLAVLGGNAYHSFHTTQMTQERDFRLQELRNGIVYLDEVLTMSARMAVATGDLRWEERYRSFEPQLGATIKRAKDLVSATKEAATQKDAARIKLGEMENLAFALVREGRVEDGRTILFGEEYEEQNPYWRDLWEEII